MHTPGYQNQIFLKGLCKEMGTRKAFKARSGPVVFLETAISYSGRWLTHPREPKPNGSAMNPGVLGR